MTKTKIPVEHKDILGQTLAEGLYVALAYKNELRIGQIVKFGAKMLRVKPLTANYRGEGALVYPAATVLLSGPDALAYILTHAGQNK